MLDGDASNESVWANEIAGDLDRFRPQMNEADGRDYRSGQRLLYDVLCFGHDVVEVVGAAEAFGVEFVDVLGA